MLPTCDSFPLIISHILFFINMKSKLQTISFVLAGAVSRFCLFVCLFVFVGFGDLVVYRL